MIGELVGNYEVLSQLGEGGMGAVYLARHRLIGRRVAIKVLLPGTSNNQEMVERFFNEARSTSAIKHAGLVDVFDFGYHNGSAYLAMELLEGESLAARIAREGRSRPELIATVGRHVASAVGAAHALGIVHRDLKPDNVFLVPDDEVAVGVRAKVLDFGIAKLGGEQRASFKTRTGSLMGTPAYMSPEQCRGAAEVDARSDIYSLGCILFEMATGRTPFVRDGLGAMMMAHMIEEAPRPRELHDAVPEALEAVILRAMAKRPEDRYPSMEAVVAALGGKTLDGTRDRTTAAFAAGTPSPSTLEGAATSLSIHSVPARRGRGRALAIAIAGLGAAALVIGAVTLAGGRGGAAPVPAASSSAPLPPSPPPAVAPIEPPPAPIEPPPAPVEPSPDPAPVAIPAPEASAPPPPETREHKRDRKRRSSSRTATPAPPPADATDAPINPFQRTRKP